MINPQWLKLSMSRTNFPGPKDVRAIEVRLYMLTDDESKKSNKNSKQTLDQLSQFELGLNILTTSRY